MSFVPACAFYASLHTSDEDAKIKVRGNDSQIMQYRVWLSMA